jgi:hypothetical protein
MIIIGPHAKTGIGQHAMKYVKLFLPDGHNTHVIGNHTYLNVIHGLIFVNSDTHSN